MKRGGWSLELRSDRFCSLPTAQASPQHPQYHHCGCTGGGDFSSVGGPHGALASRGDKSGSGTQPCTAFNGIRGKVKRGPLLGVTRQIRRVSLSRCALLSKIQNTFTHVPLSFHSLFYDQGGKRGSHREHEPRAISAASKFSILPMPCLRHTTGHSPEAVQSDLGWVYNLRGL